ncbi:MAG: hypothetical protein AB2L14_15540 [Candidatus Xenobiia bacterium LiM19]
MNTLSNSKKKNGLLGNLKEIYDITLRQNEAIQKNDYNSLYQLYQKLSSIIDSIRESEHDIINSDEDKAVIEELHEAIRQSNSTNERYLHEKLDVVKSNLGRLKDSRTIEKAYHPKSGQLSSSKLMSGLIDIRK